MTPTVVSRTWTVPLPWSTPPLSLNQRMHWAAKAKITGEVRVTAAWAVHAARVPPLRRAVMTLHYAPRDRNRRDADNLTATSKVCSDALVDACVVPDDVPEFLDHRMPVIEAPTGSKGALWLTIHEIDPTETTTP
jgi:crossover junction endodeoxyribonuclease RusA